jgi:hypothetical protein
VVERENVAASQLPKEPSGQAVLFRLNVGKSFFFFFVWFSYSKENDCLTAALLYTFTVTAEETDVYVHYVKVGENTREMRMPLLGCSLPTDYK